MYGALADAIVAAETDQAVRAIVIRGEGDMFTAGDDVGEFPPSLPAPLRVNATSRGP
jgi:enoyl-CoA hydratase/carnithine racemase